MGHFSVFYVPEKPLTPGAELTEMGRRLWQLGMPFLESSEFGDLPEHPYDPELTHEDVGMVFSTLGDPVPNMIFDLRCPHCDKDVMEAAYEAWNDEDSAVPYNHRRFPCPHCAVELAGPDLVSDEPFTFATSYLYVSEIDPEFWPAQVKIDIEAIVGPCREYMQCVP